MRPKRYNFDASGYCCQTESCKEYRKQNTGHVHFHSFIEHKGGRRAYLLCTSCKKKFSERKGTIFYRRQHSQEKISQALQALAEGTGIRATARVFQVNFKSILSWAKLGAKHIEGVEKKFSGLIKPRNTTR